MLNKIIKRVIKIFLLSLLCFSSFTYAANDEPKDQRDLLRKFFAEPFETKK